MTRVRRKGSRTIESAQSCSGDLLLWRARGGGEVVRGLPCIQTHLPVWPPGGPTLRESWPWFPVRFHFHSSPLLSLHLTPLANNQEILICLHRQPRSNSQISDLEKVTTIHPLSKIETWTASLLPPLLCSLSPSISTEEQSSANSHDLLYLLIYLFIFL